MSNRCENPLNLAYAYLLGEVEPDQVAESAVELIEAGFETEGVLLLANVHGESNDRIEAVLRRVLRDHDYEWPAVADAGKWKANCIAREVLSGSLAPYDGAVRVVREVCAEFHRLTILRCSRILQRSMKTISRIGLPTPLACERRLRHLLRRITNSDAM